MKDKYPSSNSSNFQTLAGKVLSHVLSSLPPQSSSSSTSSLNLNLDDANSLDWDNYASDPSFDVSSNQQLVSSSNLPPGSQFLDLGLPLQPRLSTGCNTLPQLLDEEPDIEHEDQNYAKHEPDNKNDASNETDDQNDASNESDDPDVLNNVFISPNDQSIVTTSLPTTSKASRTLTEDSDLPLVVAKGEAAQLKRNSLSPAEAAPFSNLILCPIEDSNHSCPYTPVAGHPPPEPPPESEAAAPPLLPRPPQTTPTLPPSSLSRLRRRTRQDYNLLNEYGRDGKDAWTGKKLFVSYFCIIVPDQI